MYEHYRLKELRKAYSRQGWTLLIYYGILNVSVILMTFLETFIHAFALAFSAGEVDGEQLAETVVEQSGWGYFLAIGIGLLILLLWKKPGYFTQTIWAPGKPMTAGSFFSILAIFTGAQLGVQLLYLLLEFVFNQFGLSMSVAMESAGGNANSLSMFLYIGLGAPISEELLFRGLIMRSMVPYGKKFAIVGSGVLFGLYHCNLIQIPFGFLIGLVLGYVTVEYNIGWAIVLHMFNNLILSDTLGRLMGLFGSPWSELWFWFVIVGCAIAAVVILLCNRLQIKKWFGQYQDDPLCVRAFWGAAGIITLIAVMVLLTLFSTLLMLTPIQ